MLVRVVGLFALAGFLTQRYYAARVQTAERHYASGNELLRAKRDAEAIEQYRAALSLTHDNRYRLALAQVLAKTDRTNEAEMYLREVIRTDVDNGPAQLALARIASKAGRADEAVTAYRRAIGDTWPATTGQERLEADFELVDLLPRTGTHRLAVAELLRLTDQTKAPSMLDRIGEGFQALGSPTQAVDVFRQVLASKRSPPLHRMPPT